ncbi:MAG TPA: ankyrin repeat domain-containing protein [Planctomycetaceae bacterium]|nr:ankyrin repeat domain-containing protein [Planctomycetaceae bacterium]
MALLLSAAGLGAASDVADAVMRGDAAGVRRLLEQKADVNLAQVDGATALHWAIYRDDLEVAELLIGAGANVNAANRAGVTPLAMASLYGSAALIERLLNAGADAKERGPDGETTVMLAARNGNAQAIKLLVAAGADVNAKESTRGTTALMWAATQGHPAAVRALVELGADVAARSGPAGLPRNYMAGKVGVEAVKAAPRIRAAAAAAGRTFEEQLEFERSQGANLAGRDGGGASSQGRSAAAAQAEANDQQDVIIAGLVGGGSGGLTPLVFAAREGDIESAKVLIEAGADVNQVTEYGWSPLLTATNNRNYELGAMLIERGADVNIANKGGWTPLYLATDNRNIEGGDYPVLQADMDHLEYIRLLLEKGANPNAQVRENTLSRTIFTQQWFFEAGATALVRASQSSDVALIKLLLSYGADPQIRTSNGDTALTASAGIGWVDGVTYERSAKENVDAVRLLLDLGLDPNAANNEGRTALMGAAGKGRNEVVQLLVDRGARLDTRDLGSRDTDRLNGSDISGHTWQALDYSEGLVRFGVQSAIARPETAALIRKLMGERGLRVPPAGRDVLSICVVEICQ